jgi:hypothetical protein
MGFKEVLLSTSFPHALTLFGNVMTRKDGKRWVFSSLQKKSSYSGVGVRQNGDNPQYQDKGVGRE